MAAASRPVGPRHENAVSENIMLNIILGSEATESGFYDTGFGWPEPTIIDMLFNHLVNIKWSHFGFAGLHAHVKAAWI